MAKKRNKIFYKKNLKFIIPSKNKHKIVRIRNLGIFTIIFLTVISLILIFRTDLFFIHKTEIEIDNNFGCVSEKEILEPLQVQGKSLFFFDSKKNVEVLLDKFVCLEKVVMTKKWPDVLMIKVAERKPVLLLRIAKDGAQTKIFDFDLTSSQSAEFFLEKLSTSSSQFSQNFFIVDNQGKIFKIAEKTGGLPILRVSLSKEPEIGEKIVGIDFAINLLSKLKDESFEVSEAEIINPSNIYVYLKEGPQIEFSSDKDLSWQVSSLQLILTQAKIEGENLKLVDLRYDKPVLIK